MKAKLYQDNDEETDFKIDELDLQENGQEKKSTGLTIEELEKKGNGEKKKSAEFSMDDLD